MTDFGNSEMGQCLGLAALILAVCLGVGGCFALVSMSEKSQVQKPLDSLPLADAEEVQK